MRRIAHHRVRALACLLAGATLLGGCRARHEVAVELRADGSGVFAVVSALDAEARRLVAAGGGADDPGSAGGTDGAEGADGGAGRPPPPVTTYDGIVEEPWRRGDLAGTRSSLPFDDLGELAEVLDGAFATDTVPRPASVSREGRTVTIVVDTRPAVRELLDALGAGDERGDEADDEARDEPGDEGRGARVADASAPSTTTPSTATSSTASTSTRSPTTGTSSTAPPPTGTAPAPSLLDEVTRALDLHLALRVEGRVLDHNGDRRADRTVVWPLLPVPSEASRVRVLLHPGDRDGASGEATATATRDHHQPGADGARGEPDGRHATGPRATPRALAIVLAVLAVLAAAGTLVATRRQRPRRKGWKTLP